MIPLLSSSHCSLSMPMCCKSYPISSGRAFFGITAFLSRIRNSILFSLSFFPLFSLYFIIFDPFKKNKKKQKKTKKNFYLKELKTTLKGDVCCQEEADGR